MNAFPADYFDGRSSRRVPVLVSVSGTRVAIDGEDVTLAFDRPELRALPRVGRTPVRVLLPDGGLLVASGADVAEDILALEPETTLAHRLESHARVVVVALAIVVAAAYAAYEHGIPWASDRIVRAIPESAEASLGPKTLAALDGSLLEPSRLKADLQGDLRAEFDALAAQAGAAAGTRLEFRRGGILGPNAFALPGGIVVVTDELAQIAEPREFVAIMAHELGHQQGRHTLRMMVGSSLHALLSFAVLGDAGGAAAQAAILPNLLLQAGYSRDYEREADRFALDLLKRTHRSSRDFADAMRRIDRYMKDKESRDGTRSYLSTHPETADRIEEAERAAR